jgi:hypothetical protein
MEQQHDKKDREKSGDYVVAMQKGLKPGRCEDKKKEQRGYSSQDEFITPRSSRNVCTIPVISVDVGHDSFDFLRSAEFTVANMRYWKRVKR